MKNTNIKFFFCLMILIATSCSSNKILVQKEKTEFGNIRFYIENKLKDYKSQKRLVAKIDQTTYQLNQQEILKQTDKEPNIIYTLIEDNILKSPNTNIYQKLTISDSLILLKCNKILDSLKWNNFKRFKDQKGFIKEVYYYHQS
ncbi:hypothetical protein ML462_15785 [Gramella lutea]|uniref:Lipoprotein n=1 Tax=Christiangramia lutea TaxID=1607951 RepID=A0A9X2AAL4_9FLAO|nr:hypothetical protein [Christiangramia lutea]MCH4824635.1 hypothetical protein [Christiangramia lutea]